MRKLIILFCVIILSFFTGCNNNRNEENAKIKETEEVFENKIAVDFAADYSEWVYNGDDFQLQLVLCDSFECLILTKNEEEILLDFNYRMHSNNEFGFEIKKDDDQQVICSGDAYLKDNKMGNYCMVLKNLKSSELINNKKEIVFEEVNDSIPKMAVAAYLRTFDKKIFGTTTPAYIQYEQISGNDSAGKVRLIAKNVIDKSNNVVDYTFDIRNKNENEKQNANETYAFVYLNDELVYTFDYSLLLEKKEKPYLINHFNIEDGRENLNIKDEIVLNEKQIVDIAKTIVEFDKGNYDSINVYHNLEEHKWYILIGKVGWLDYGVEVILSEHGDLISYIPQGG